MQKLYLIRANKKLSGGAEMYLAQLSAQLEKRKIDHAVLHSSLPKFLPAWLRVLLFDFMTCRKKEDKFYFSLDRISCPDIYRTDDGVHKVFLSIENKSKTNPLHRVYLALEEKAFRRAKKIIAISGMVKNNIIDAYGIDPSKIVVIYNGIELQEYDTSHAFPKLSKEFRIAQAQKIITFVGSGFKRKGVEEFLHIISRLKYDDFKAFIIGKEKKLSCYEDMARQLGLENKVVFTGPRKDVNDFYVISDIFLFPSRYDPFGNVILEAMQFSNAVITTRQCGAGEILDEAFVMDRPDDYSIAATIDGLLNDDRLLDEIKAKNRRTVQSFTIEKNVEETLKVIHEIIY
ncbi:glycosyltransferase family 4 protein [Sulfurovum sp.]|uniref:glycosyltransferase family 4 protein n=1 Tax=Sulfurovum sp. TaxID=1969726 RepID=UPI0025EC4E7A|nr:glycosyltransferase family 4 protein [Sulfurovum sp.]